MNFSFLQQVKNTKKIVTFAAVLLAGAMHTHAQTNLKTQLDTVSYCIGSSLQDGLKQQGLDSVSAMQLAGGMATMLSGGNPMLNMTQAQSLVQQYMMQKYSGKQPNFNVDTLSYALGMMIAQNLQSQGFEKLDVAQFAAGFDDNTNGKASISPQQANNLIEGYLRTQSEKRYAGVKEAGAKFLAENGKRPEVKTTASGLQYEVLKQGSGSTPLATDTVTTHYHGTLISGKVFDSSVERGTPIDFPVNRVIAGWTEALQLMKVGSKYRLYIPYNLAYGERGAGASIGPFETLIFDVELIKVNGHD